MMDDVEPNVDEELPVVGIGASAGGLQALEALLSAMPPKPGVACIVVVHLDAEHKSMLPELLQRSTPLRVTLAEAGQLVEADVVYVLPPGMQLTLRGGALNLVPVGPRSTRGLVIDTFFRSLAADCGDRAVAIVLSGTGTDGTLGLRAVKAAGGIVMVQDASARFDGMPRSAVGTGLADYVLAAEDMPEILLHHLSEDSQRLVIAPEPATRALRQILALLCGRTGHDFSAYKTTTIARRTRRRMAVLHLESLSHYLDYLRATSDEADTLFRELLIGVTSFFRDPEAFETLGADFIAPALALRSPDHPFRVWVPACSTGEEAYTIAILIHEACAARGSRPTAQVFGTDIDARAIEVARAGFYPSGIAADLSSERLERYFDRLDDGRYRVKKHLREMLVFAPQSLIKDPPFSKLDLISCRNFLIYLAVELQGRLLSLFHYSLQPGGLLLLGSSETLGRATERFEVGDRKWKIFVRRALSPTANLILDLPRRTLQMTNEPDDVHVPVVDRRVEAVSLIRAVLRQSDTPPCAVVDAELNIIFVHGSTGRFLEPPEGHPSQQLLRMARPGLRSPLAACLRASQRGREEVRQRGVSFASDGGEVTVELIVRPIFDPPSLGNLTVIFFAQEPASALAALPDGEEVEGGEGDEHEEFRRLRQQLG